MGELLQRKCVRVLYLESVDFERGVTMVIEEILQAKRAELLHYGLPTAAKFSLEEIEALSTGTLLRVFKLTHPFPSDFERSQDLLDCTKRIVAGDCIYRVLEFCILKNKILRKPVTGIFPRLGETNENFRH